MEDQSHIPNSMSEAISFLKESHCYASDELIASCEALLAEKITGNNSLIKDKSFSFDDLCKIQQDKLPEFASNKPLFISFSSLYSSVSDVCVNKLAITGKLISSSSSSEFWSISTDSDRDAHDFLLQDDLCNHSRSNFEIKSVISKASTSVSANNITVDYVNCGVGRGASLSASNLRFLPTIIEESFLLCASHSLPFLFTYDTGVSAPFAEIPRDVCLGGADKSVHLEQFDDCTATGMPGGGKVKWPIVQQRPCLRYHPASNRSATARMPSPLRPRPTTAHQVTSAPTCICSASSSLPEDSSLINMKSKFVSDSITCRSQTYGDQTETNAECTLAQLYCSNSSNFSGRVLYVNSEAHGNHSSASPSQPNFTTRSMHKSVHQDAIIDWKIYKQTSTNGSARTDRPVLINNNNNNIYKQDSALSSNHASRNIPNCSNVPCFSEMKLENLHSLLLKNTRKFVNQYSVDKNVTSFTNVSKYCNIMKSHVNYFAARYHPYCRNINKIARLEKFLGSMCVKSRLINSRKYCKESGNKFLNKLSTQANAPYSSYNTTSNCMSHHNNIELLDDVSYLSKHETHCNEHNSYVLSIAPAAATDNCGSNCMVTSFADLCVPLDNLDYFLYMHSVCCLEPPCKTVLYVNNSSGCCVTADACYDAIRCPCDGYGLNATKSKFVPGNDLRNCRIRNDVFYRSSSSNEQYEEVTSAGIWQVTLLGAGKAPTVCASKFCDLIKGTGGCAAACSSSADQQVTGCVRVVTHRGDVLHFPIFQCDTLPCTTPWTLQASVSKSWLQMLNQLSSMANLQRSASETYNRPILPKFDHSSRLNAFKLIKSERETVRKLVPYFIEKSKTDVNYVPFRSRKLFTGKSEATKRRSDVCDVLMYRDANIKHEQSKSDTSFEDDSSQTIRLCGVPLGTQPITTGSNIFNNHNQRCVKLRYTSPSTTPQLSIAGSQSCSPHRKISSRDVSAPPGTLPVPPTVPSDSRAGSDLSQDIKHNSSSTSRNNKHNDYNLTSLGFKSNADQKTLSSDCDKVESSPIISSKELELNRNNNASQTIIPYKNSTNTQKESTDMEIIANNQVTLPDIPNPSNDGQLDIRLEDDPLVRHSKFDVLESDTDHGQLLPLSGHDNKSLDYFPFAELYKSTDADVKENIFSGNLTNSLRNKDLSQNNGKHIEQLLVKENDQELQNNLAIKSPSESDRSSPKCTTIFTSQSLISENASVQYSKADPTNSNISNNEENSLQVIMLIDLSDNNSFENTICSSSQLQNDCTSTVSSAKAATVTSCLLLSENLFNESIMGSNSDSESQLPYLTSISETVPSPTYLEINTSGTDELYSIADTIAAASTSTPKQYRSNETASCPTSFVSTSNITNSSSIIIASTTLPSTTIVKTLSILASNIVNTFSHAIIDKQSLVSSITVCTSSNLAGQVQPPTHSVTKQYSVNIVSSLYSNKTVKSPLISEIQSSGKQSLNGTSFENCKSETPSLSTSGLPTTTTDIPIKVSYAPSTVYSTLIGDCDKTLDKINNHNTSSSTSFRNRTDIPIVKQHSAEKLAKQISLFSTTVVTCSLPDVIMSVTTTAVSSEKNVDNRIIIPDESKNIFIHTDLSPRSILNENTMNSGNEINNFCTTSSLATTALCSQSTNGTIPLMPEQLSFSGDADSVYSTLYKNNKTDSGVNVLTLGTTCQQLLHSGSTPSSNAKESCMISVSRPELQFVLPNLKNSSELLHNGATVENTISSLALTSSVDNEVVPLAVHSDLITEAIPVVVMHSSTSPTTNNSSKSLDISLSSEMVQPFHCVMSINGELPNSLKSETKDTNLSDKHVLSDVIPGRQPAQFSNDDTNRGVILGQRAAEIARQQGAGAFKPRPIAFPSDIIRSRSEIKKQDKLSIKEGQDQSIIKSSFRSKSISPMTIHRIQLNTNERRFKSTPPPNQTTTTVVLCNDEVNEKQEPPKNNSAHYRNNESESISNNDEPTEQSHSSFVNTVYVDVPSTLTAITREQVPFEIPLQEYNSSNNPPETYVSNFTRVTYCDVPISSDGLASNSTDKTARTELNLPNCPSATNVRPLLETNPIWPNYIADKMLLNILDFSSTKWGDLNAKKSTGDNIISDTHSTTECESIQSSAKPVSICSNIVNFEFINTNSPISSKDSESPDSEQTKSLPYIDESTDQASLIARVGDESVSSSADRRTGAEDGSVSTSNSSNGSEAWWAPGGPAICRDKMPLDEETDSAPDWCALLSPNPNLPETDVDKTGYASDDDFDAMDEDMRRLEEKIKQFEHELEEDLEISLLNDVSKKMPNFGLLDKSKLRSSPLPSHYPPVSLTITKHLSLMTKRNIEEYLDSSSDSESDSSNTSDNVLFVKRKIKLKPGDRKCRSLDLQKRTFIDECKSEYLMKMLSLTKGNTNQLPRDDQLHQNTSNSEDNGTQTKESAPMHMHYEDFKMSGHYWKPADGIAELDSEELANFYSNSKPCGVVFIFEDDSSDDLEGGPISYEHVNYNRTSGEQNIPNSIFSVPHQPEIIQSIPSHSTAFETGEVCEAIENKSKFALSFKSSFMKATKCIGPKLNRNKSKTSTSHSKEDLLTVSQSSYVDPSVLLADLISSGEQQSYPTPSILHSVIVQNVETLLSSESDACDGSIVSGEYHASPAICVNTYEENIPEYKLFKDSPNIESSFLPLRNNTFSKEHHLAAPTPPVRRSSLDAVATCSPPGTIQRRHNKGDGRNTRLTSNLPEVVPPPPCVPPRTTTTLNYYPVRSRPISIGDKLLKIDYTVDARFGGNPTDYSSNQSDADGGHKATSVRQLKRKQLERRIQLEEEEKNEATGCSFCIRRSRTLTDSRHSRFQRRHCSPHPRALTLPQRRSWPPRK